MVWSTGMAGAEIVLGKDEQNQPQVIFQLDGTGFPHRLKTGENR